MVTTMLLAVGAVVGVWALGRVWAKGRHRSPCRMDGMTLENAWIVMALRRKDHP